MENKMQNIINCAIRYFINSCGLVMIFTVYSNKMLSIEEIKSFFSFIFSFQCAFRIVVEIIDRYIINKYELWFCQEKEVSIPVKEKAVKSTRNTGIVLDKQVEKILDVISIHEAGHAIAALANEMKVIEVRINSENGYTKLEEKPVVLLNGEYFEKLAVIDYAGAAAEEIFTGEIHAGCIGTETADFEMAEKNIRKSMLLYNEHGWKTSAGQEFDSELQKQSKEFYRKAYQIIMNNKENVRLIAACLRTGEQMTGEEIKNRIAHAVREG